MRTSFEPPWMKYPDTEPWWGGWRQGYSEAWLDEQWFPRWRRMTPAERTAYVEAWDTPEEWRHMLLGPWFAHSVGEGAANSEPLRWPQWYVGGPWTPELESLGRAVWWKRLPVLGSALAAALHSHLRRRKAPLDEFYRAHHELMNYVRQRSEESRRSWGVGTARATMAEFVCAMLRRNTRWPSSHFIPDDPLDVVLGGVWRQEPFETMLSAAFGGVLETSAIRALMSGTVGEFVDRLVGLELSPPVGGDWQGA